MIYLRKELEARAYVAQINAGQTPDLADYKFLTMEIGITAPDAVVAQVWLNRSALWEIVGSTIENRYPPAPSARSPSQPARPTSTPPSRRSPPGSRSWTGEIASCWQVAFAPFFS